VQVEEGAGAQKEAGGDQPGGDEGADCWPGAQARPPQGQCRSHLVRLPVFRTPVKGSVRDLITVLDHYYFMKELKNFFKQFNVAVFLLKF
jgi:hypothetical protein